MPSDAHVRARTAKAVVYRAGDRVLACLERSGSPTLLKRVYDDVELGRERVGAVAIAGPRVAFADLTTYRSQSSAVVLLVDLRHPQRRVSAGDAASNGVDTGYPTVPRLFLARDGAVAYTVHWIGFDAPRVEDRTRHREVRIRDAFGLRTVDDAPEVDLRSLERRGRTMTWRHGAGTRSTRLHRTGRCSLPWNAEVRAHGSGTLVYETPHEGRIRVHACSLRTGARQLLGSQDGTNDHYPVGSNYTVAGDVVAWSEDHAHQGSQAEYIRVYDLRAHTMLRSIYAGGHGPSQYMTSTIIAALVLARDGAVAWTTRDYDGPDLEDRFVTARDACGRRKLDDNAEIDPESLRLAGRRVSWTVGGAGRSATFRSAADC